MFGVANFAAFEIDDEVLTNLKEYALANSLFWVCEARNLLRGQVADRRIRRRLQRVMHVSSRLAVMQWT